MGKIKEQTGNIIPFAKFEEGGILSETCNDVESGEKYDEDSIMPPLLSEEEMYAMDFGDESDHDNIFTEMLEEIHDGSQSHPKVNRREARYKIRDRIKQRQPEYKGALKSTQNMGKCLQKVFNTVVKGIYKD